MNQVGLPDGFVFGVATSAWQIEGAVAEDGRGASIWDTFSRRPGAISTGETGDPACEHYHRWPEDLDLVARLGVDAYRFSIAWPRIQPEGTGPVNRAGLDYYSRLVDGMLERGLVPWATLYHWDLPQALEDAGDLGGWLERDTAYRYADYAAVVAEHLGDRVRHWTTLNEPFASAQVGYQQGTFAPGRREGSRAFRAVHHHLLAHGLGVDAVRGAAATDVEVGIVLDLWDVHPDSPRPDDVAAARRFDGWKNRVYTDPLFAGRYPADLDAFYPRWRDHDPIVDGDLAIVQAPIDTVGVNYYFPARIAADGEAPLGRVAPWPDQPQPDGATLRVPESFTRVLTRLGRDYPGLPPLIVTENGSCDPSDPELLGSLEDEWRVQYVESHLAAVAEAIRQGADVRGYFCWSLLDNVEWAAGTTMRFGLVHVDFTTQARTPKTSYWWLKSLLEKAAARS